MKDHPISKSADVFVHPQEKPRKQMPKGNNPLPIFLRDVQSITIHQEVIEIQTDHKTFEITGFGDNVGLELNWKENQKEDKAIEHVLTIYR